MECTLTDGSTVQLTPEVAEAILSAEPTPQAPQQLVLRGHIAPNTLGALTQQELAKFHSQQSLWVLTSRGAEVHHLAHTKPAEPDEPEPERLTTHPKLSGANAKHLNLAFAEKKKSEEIPGHRSEQSSEKWVNGILLPMSALLLILIWAFTPHLLTFSLIGLTIIIFSVPKIVEQTKRRQAPYKYQPEAVLNGFQDSYISADMLDGKARALLGRVQSAVDTVLGSPLHQRGDLLDRTRNKVVLTDLEWSLAESLLRHSRTRRQLAETRTPGERSRQAAEKVRVNLDEDVRQALSRVRTLESYADTVRAAELEPQDRQTATELNAIAESTAQERAGDYQQDEALRSLNQAREFARRIAELTTLEE